MHTLAGPRVGCNEFDFVSMMKDFNVHFNKVKDYKDIFVEAGGDASADAVNRLRGRTITPTGEHKYFFISEYATHRSLYQVR